LPCSVMQWSDHVGSNPTVRWLAVKLQQRYAVIHWTCSSVTQ
jgi:hypothetical protein